MATRSLACVVPLHQTQQFWHSTSFQERQLTVRDQVNCKLTCSSNPPKSFWSLVATTFSNTGSWLWCTECAQSGCHEVLGHWTLHLITFFLVFRMPFCSNWWLVFWRNCILYLEKTILIFGIISIVNLTNFANSTKIGKKRKKLAQILGGFLICNWRASPPPTSVNGLYTLLRWITAFKWCKLSSGL